MVSETASVSGAAEPRSVEEGDIYRVLAGGLLLNLNSFRGLQVIDVGDPAAPTIVGRFRVAGAPVEMYVVNDQVIILLNNWQGYAVAGDGPLLRSHNGGLLLKLDLTNPARPTELSRLHVPGRIQKSRLAREGNQASLYVAGSQSGHQRSRQDRYRQLDGRVLQSTQTSFIDRISIAGRCRSKAQSCVGWCTWK